MGHSIKSERATEAGQCLIFIQRPKTPAARLSKISHELDLLVTELERETVSAPRPDSPPDIPEMPRLKRYLKMRRERERLFPKLFGDPAWDMLLLLYVYRAARVPLQVSAIAGLANVPGTTSLRYLDLMIEQQLINRTPDPRDRRRIWLTMTPKAVKLLEQWLTTLP
ncbi:MAG: hypothetical protein MEQ84_14245 [Mesorhizobium sp.]|nr:hypothetical protein [Mesorhizobium sp.]